MLRYYCITSQAQTGLTCESHVLAFSSNCAPKRSYFNKVQYFVEIVALLPLGGTLSGIFYKRVSLLKGEKIPNMISKE